MKRLFIILTILISSVLLFSCTTKENVNTEEKKVSEETTNESKEENVEQKEVENTEAKKVIAGTMAVTNLLDKLEYENVIGVPESHYPMPERYKDVTNIGSPRNPDAEVIKSLNPDLFITESSLKDIISKNIANLNIPVDFTNMKSYDEIIESIRYISKILGTTEKAEELISEIENDRKTAEQNAEGKTSPKILAMLANPKSVMAATDKSYLGDLLNILHADNIVKHDEAYIPFSLDNIIEQDPDYILIMSHGNIEMSKKILKEQFESNPAWNNLKATKNNHIIYLDDALFNNSGNVFVGQALKNLSNIIYEN